MLNLAEQRTLISLKFSIFFVGVAGFEPATSWSQTRRDNRATLHPENVGANIALLISKKNLFLIFLAILSLHLFFTNKIYIELNFYFCGNVNNTT